MYQKTHKIILLTILALLLSVSGVTGQTPGGDNQPQEIESIAAVLASRINYQGLLRESGAPVTGSRDMVFRFYSNNTCTTLVGADIVKNGVAVSNGLFSVNLDVPQANFDGQALWLKVAVGAVSLGCREIVAAPYALSLRPGARIEGSGTGLTVVSDATNGQAIRGETTATTGETYSVYGRNSSPEGQAVFGYATAATGVAIGVLGHTNSTAGYGVAGDARATTGTVYGVYGVSRSPAGRGVYGGNTATTGTNYGGFFESNSPTGRGVVGVARHTTSTSDNFGVRGEANSPEGIGVGGYALSATGSGALGVYGRSDSPSGKGVYGNATETNGIGVYGRATATNGNYGVYSYGNIGKTGTMMTLVQTRLNGWVGLHGMESAEALFEDVGTAQLVNGRASVALDPIFAQTVNLKQPYQVFLTPMGDCGLYVAEKTEAAFTVQALGGKPCSIAFDYRIVAKRLGYENQRLMSVESPELSLDDEPERTAPTSPLEVDAP